MSQLAEARIADLVRRKLTSGNSVPVERCTIFAKEIAKIDEEVAAIEAANKEVLSEMAKLAVPKLTIPEIFKMSGAASPLNSAEEEAELDAYVKQRRIEVQATIPLEDANGT